MARKEPDLFGYTGEGDPRKLARRSDPHTSHEAAERVVPGLTRLRKQVYDLLLDAGPHGLTDWEIEERLRNHGSTYRTRRAELVEMDWVEAAPGTRIIKGRARKIWRIK
jgi:hypothetical protein